MSRYNENINWTAKDQREFDENERAMEEQHLHDRVTELESLVSALESQRDELQAKVEAKARVLKAAGFDEEATTEGEWMNQIECGLPPKATRMIAELQAIVDKLPKDKNGNVLIPDIDHVHHPDWLGDEEWPEAMPLTILHIDIVREQYAPHEIEDIESEYPGEAWFGCGQQYDEDRVFTRQIIVPTTELYSTPQAAKEAQSHE